MVLIIRFGDTRKAKIAAIVMGSLALLCLVITAVLWGINAYKMNSYDRVPATVTQFDTRDGKNVWTEFRYEYKNETKTVRLKGHSYWMRVNSEVELIINPKRPENVDVITPATGKMPIVPLIPAGLFAFFFILYFFNYRSNLKRDKKAASQ